MNHHRRKGSQIYVDGRIRTDTWRDHAGQERKTVVIAANRLLMLGRREDQHNHAVQTPADMSWLDGPAPTTRSSLGEDEYPF